MRALFLLKRACRAKAQDEGQAAEDDYPQICYLGITPQAQRARMYMKQHWTIESLKNAAREIIASNPTNAHAAAQVIVELLDKELEYRLAGLLSGDYTACDGYCQE